MKFIAFVLMTFIVVLFSIEVSAQGEPVFWVAFTAVSHDTTNAESCTYGLCLVRSDGTAPARSLTEDVSYNTPLAWSPDGSWLAYVNEKGDLERIDPRNMQISIIASHRNLAQLSESTKTVDAASDCNCTLTQISWSPDGQRLFLLLEKQANATELLSLDVNGGQVQEIATTSDQYTISSFELSPRGDWIAFSRKTRCNICDSGENLYKVRPDGKDVQLLSDDGSTVGSFAWSPDSEKIYFSEMGKDDKSVIYAVASDGSGRHLVLTNSWQNPYIPSLAVTEHFVFFLPPPPTSMDQHEKVYRLDIASGNVSTVPEANLLGDGFDQILAVALSDSIVAIGTDVEGLGVYGMGVYILESSGKVDLLAGYPILEIGSVSLSSMPTRYWPLCFSANEGGLLICTP